MQTNVDQCTRVYTTIYPILIAISIGQLTWSHAVGCSWVFSILGTSMHLSYSQIGWIAFN